MMVSLLIIILIFTIISLGFIYTQNSKFVGINQEASQGLSIFTDKVINQNIKQYVGDLTTACGRIIDSNYDANRSRGDSTAAYIKNLYEKGNTQQKDISYGVGFIGGITEEKLEEFYKIADIREYISSLPGYDSENLDALDVFVVTKSGLVLDGTKTNLGENYRDLRNDSWYIDGYEAGEPVWTDVIVGSVTGDKKIDYVVPIIIDNEFMGVTVVSAPITEIYNTLLNIDFQGIRDIILTDSKGERVAGSEEYSIEDVEDTGDIIFHDDYCMSKYRVDEAGSSVYFVFDVAEVLSAVNKVESEIEQNGNTIKDFTFKFIAAAVAIYILLALIMTAIAIVYSRKIANALVSPILLLSKKVEEFGKGNMDINVDDIKTNDEVGMLAHKFSAMSEDIKDYLKKITAITAEKERFKTEMEAAANIQSSLMSSEFPKSDMFDVYACMKPARAVGGDLYAVLQIDNEHLLTAVADVSGKGIPASLFSVRTKVYIQLYGEMGLKPSQILKNVNERLCQNNDEALFVTAFLGVLDVKTGRFTYSNAGHNKPVITGQDTKWLDAPGNVPLGCIEGVDYTDEVIYLKNGDGVFIYSDGVTEAVGADDTFFGDGRLLNKLSQLDEDLSGKEVIEGISAELRLYSADREQWDDITMLMVKYTNENGAKEQT